MRMSLSSGSSAPSTMTSGRSTTKGVSLWMSPTGASVVRRSTSWPRT